MSYINTETDIHEIAPRIVAVITGAILLKFGLLLSSLFPPIGNPLSLISMVGLYGSAFVLIGAATTGIDFEKWGKPLAYGLLCTTILAAYTAYASRAGGNVFGTDGILFSQYAVDLLLSGQNPYANSMAPAFEKYAVASEYVTYKRDASFVHSFSYPSLAFLWFVPQALLGIPNLNLTAVAVVLACLGYLIHITPNRYAIAPFAVMFADPSILAFSYGGVFDILWVLPLLIGMRFWTTGKYGYGAFILGLAFATKQTPWFIAPFLAVWIFHERETLAEVLRTTRNTMAAGLAGFLLPNIPFIIWNPSAWVNGVLTPVSGGVSLVQQGRGLVMLSVSGAYALPKTFFTISLLTVLAVSLLAYTLYYEKLKWAIWVVPMVVLWFNYRSLQNYFVFFIPIAYLTILLSVETPGLESLSSRDLWTPSSDITAKTRGLLLVGVGIVAVVGLVGTGILMHSGSELDADVTIDNMSDPYDMHRVSQINFTVTNNEDYVITPKFHFKHTGVQTHSYWDIHSGPDTLAPGETETYTVQPDTPKFAIPYGGQVVIKMNDGGTSKDVTLETQTIESKDIETILNPTFKFWENGIVHTNPSPYRWSITKSSPGPEDTTIERIDSGIRAKVSEVNRTSGPWEMAGLQQNSPFPTEITVNATPETLVENPSKYPPRATGVEFSENNHRVWIVFADVNERKIVTREGNLEYTIVYIPATEGEQTTASVNITALYEAQDWQLPPKQQVNVDGQEYIYRQGSVLGFAATYPGTETGSEIVFHSITTTPHKSVKSSTTSR